MDETREILERAGVPVGAPRPPPTALPDAAALRLAVRDSMHRPEVCPTEALLAWLSGFAHHWPEGFARVLGEGGHTAIGVLAARPVDRNKYLKLRRIAIENLARCV
ncbi:MAG: hypothetical protein JNL21_18285 [Myxococcales bacterium]|nr:hypothetical protein [Myxococcales bacterium]